MTKQVQRRRGTASQHTSFTGAEGEISVNTTNKSVHVHDGVTAGGVEAARADLANVSDASLNTALAGNTLSSLTITSADINGGTIDGTVIGGTTPAAVTATSLTATGTTTLAGASTTADITFGDNDKAIFGAGSDLQIYHNPTNGNSYIEENGTGDLRILANNIWLADYSGQKQLTTTANAETKLYYNGSQKLATTSTGVDVTGTVTADGLTVDGNGAFSGTDTYLAFIETDLTNESTRLRQTSGSLYIQKADNSGGFLQNLAQFDTNGDISFYEDTGTTPKFFWNSDAETLYLGTYNGAGTPSGSLFVDSNANNHAIHIEETGGGSESWQIGVNTDGDLGFYNSQSTTASITFDDSGNLLVGRTDTSSATAGTVIYGGSLKGAITQTFAGRPLYINRLTSDGDIIEFAKDGTTVGSIGSRLGANIVITAPTATYFDSSIRPLSDNSKAIGTSTLRFTDLYLSGGVYLGGTGAANKLDDYEYGDYQVTFTPSGGGSITVSGSHDDLKYTKIGSRVFVTGKVDISAVSSPSGYISVTLPFVVHNSGTVNDSRRFTGSVWVINAAIETYKFQLYGIEGESSVRIYNGSGTSLASTSANQFSGDESVAFSFNYETTP